MSISKYTHECLRFFQLKFSVSRFLDTSLISIDLEVNYVRVTVKKKIFQLALAQEIKVNDSTSKRSQITGALLIVMPKLNYNELDLKLEEKANTLKAKP